MVVDILRASTTISVALASGADRVIPCASISDATQLRKTLGADTCLLGGERGGIRIEGFDLSNSPDDYRPDVVGGRTIGFTTTNGTNALLKAKQADSVVIGSFSNLSSVLNRLQNSPAPVHIVCAGTNGAITGEDVLFAGALSTRLLDANPGIVVSDSTTLALNHWKSECGTLANDAVEAALRKSQGGRNLIRLGYDSDIATAAAVDTVQSSGTVQPDGAITIE